MRHISVLRGSSPDRKVPDHESAAAREHAAGSARFPCSFPGSELYRFELDGDYFIFDVRSCSLLKARGIAKEIMIEISDEVDSKSMMRLKEKFSSEELTEGFREVDFLVHHGFLQTKENSQENLYVDLDFMDSVPVNMLSLGLTGTCNLACSYCFEKQERSASFLKMSRTVAAAAVDFLFENAGPVPHLAIRFFGGEPLLNMPIISFVTSYATEQARNRNKNIIFLLSTNGTLISDEVADFLIEYKVGVCISLDGPRHVHDIHRRFKNGRGSFRRAKQGASRLLARGPSRLQAQAVLTRQNLGHMREMAGFFRDMGFSGIHAGLVDSKNESDYSLSDELLEDFNKDYVRLVMDCMIEANPCRFNLSGHDTIVRRIYHTEPSYYPCLTHAGINMLHIAPSGDVFPCYRLTGNEYRLGNLLEGIDRLQGNQVRRHFVNDHVDLNDCRECWARYLCGGRCPAHFRHKANKAFPEKCHLRDRMALNLRLYARLWHKHRALLDSLYNKG